MKLRIRGNSLRLRLTRGEVSAVLRGGAMRDAIDFGPARMEYALVAGDGPALVARYEHGALTVEAPREALAKWAASDQVALAAEQPLARGALHILVEKDFACLTARPHEDDSDAFENPQQHHGEHSHA